MARRWPRPSARAEASEPSRWSHKDAGDDSTVEVILRGIISVSPEHRMLASATHNRLMVLLLDSIRDLMQEYFLSTLPHVDIGGQVMPDHRRILDRVIAHDAEGARRAMWQHHTSAPWEKSLDQDLMPE